MFELRPDAKIKVSQGDTFALNVVSSIPFEDGDIATLTVKDELDTTNYVIEKVVTEFKNIELDDASCCCCGGKAKKGDIVGLVRFNFTSLDTSKEAGNYYYDIQFDFKKTNIRYTAMYPTRFTIVEDVTNNTFEMAELMPSITPGG